MMIPFINNHFLFQWTDFYLFGQWHIFYFIFKILRLYTDNVFLTTYSNWDVI